MNADRRDRLTLAIEAIKGRELLDLIQVSSFTHTTDDDRKRILRDFKARAYPGTNPDQPPVFTTQKMAAFIRGRR